jgi:hypothetical protein
MVFEHQAEYDSQWAALNSIVGKIGCTDETLLKWVRLCTGNMTLVTDRVINKKGSRREAAPIQDNFYMQSRYRCLLFWEWHQWPVGILQRVSIRGSGYLHFAASGGKSNPKRFDFFAHQTQCAYV